MEDAKKEFLHEFGMDYGYPNGPKSIDEIRASEFKRLEEFVYLDHAGSTLYSEAQMEAVVKDLTSNVYGNPHSQSDCSLASSEMIRAAREQVLDFCNAPLQDYICIFTSGATAALKLVGESFPWSRESSYMYTLENHNSVLGIREYVLEKGGRAIAVNIEKMEEKVDSSGASMVSIDALPLSEQRRISVEYSEESSNGNVYSLFAFPSECNFSGKKYPLELMDLVKKNGKFVKGSTNSVVVPGRESWMVLVDAAKGCATQHLDLTKFPVDFAVLSFYKIFGYPTGLGALVVRKDAAKLLKKTYFSGGTVSAAIADIDFVKRRDRIEQLFEDGSPFFLNIASIRHGFKIINTLTIPAISRHARSLAAYVKKILVNLRHANGAIVSKVYREECEEATFGNWGPTLAFNLKRPDGSWFGYREVEKLASLSGIQLRTGCFCNPGACAKYLDLSHSELLSNIEAGHICWDDHDILNGKPTGAVRVSFGYMSTFEDAEKLLRFIKQSFVSKTQSCNNMSEALSESTHCLRSPCLKSITIYPIKSCSGFTVDRWPLCYTGLLYDREWLLKGPSGEILTQKKVPQMSKICAFINLSQQQLSVESSNCRDTLQISLQRSSIGISYEELDMFGERFEVEVYNDDVNMWFTKAVGRPCFLVRNSEMGLPRRTRRDGQAAMCRDREGKLSFVNEAQLLLISADSVADLNDRIKSGSSRSKPNTGESVYIDPMRFRPNLVVSGAEPYAEDQWRILHIGKAQFTSLGGCNRCQMINLNHHNGKIQKSVEPLATLASFRRVQGRILFGILLRYEETHADVQNEVADSAQTWLEVGHQLVLMN